MRSWPKVQLALDLVKLEDALRIARAATEAGIEWVEAGTPLIKSEGMKAIRTLRRGLPSATIVADMKTLDAGELEVEMAFQAGAAVVSVSGLAHNRTIRDSLQAATRHRGRLMVDLLMSQSPLRRALELEKLGVDIVCVHTGVDVQRELASKLRISPTVRRIAMTLKVPVAAAGGVDPDLARRLVEAGVKLLIVGGWITGSRDPSKASRRILESVEGAKRA